MKIALGIEYNGHNYYGWQRQNNVPSLQNCLELALSRVADEPITVFCAGRTDARVHATGQVVHFETKSYRNEKAWTLGVNTYLPIDISVRWMSVVTDDFHARFSAISRRYCYIIYNHPLRPSLFFNSLAHYYQKLDVKKMYRASQFLIGEHDFTSFRSLQCKSSSSWRNLYHINIIKKKIHSNRY